MKKIYSILVCMCILASFVACEKDKDFALTTLTMTNETVTPSYEMAEVSCSFKADATISEAYVQYSLSSGFADYEVAKMTEEKGKYVALLTDLVDNTTYYIRYAASNKFSSVVTEEVVEFQTLQCAVPTIVLDSIGGVRESHAKAYLHLTFDGGASVTDMGICWSEQANPTIENMHKSTKDTAAVLDIADLQENTKYYVRAYAVNKVGVSYSEELVFTTYALPEVRTEEVTDIQVNTALLSATLVFDGNDMAIIKGFCWSDKAEPTINENHIAVDTNSANYTYLLSDLLPATEYHVRAYAKNKIGVVYGEEKIFTTIKEVMSPTVTTATITQITETAAVAGGNVTSDGGAEVTERGVVYSLSANPAITDLSSTIVRSGSGTGAFTCNLTNLQAGTTYYVRAYAINSKGTAYGDEISFTTALPITLATVTTAAIILITETSAVTGGNVTNDGNASVTERGVVYSTNPNPVITNLYNTIKPCGSGTGSFTCNLTNLQPNTTYYVRAYATNEKGTAYGEEVSFTTKANVNISDPTGTENGYGYVDLGLSVKWATCNVGASQPDEYGDYFAWGETEPKDVYDWSTYKWCYGSYESLTKYCTDSYFGTVDNKTTLEMSDDAAYKNWGGAWRMPTDEEVAELCEQCTWIWTNQNGVKGYKVISKNNGNCIFLPASGFRDDSLLSNIDNGYYWSSSLDTDRPDNAWFIHFYSSNASISWVSGRCHGKSVRPVLGENEVEVTTPTVTTTTVTQITEMSAVAGGNVMSDGGASVTERGVVYNTNPNPVITNLSNTIRPCGSGTGVFTYTMTGLQPNTTYYVRAYAKNDAGTAYGEELVFTTESVLSEPTGTENGYGYVDLGLSVKWATMNVGASSPEEYGDYFAWGETSTKSTYNWSTYTLCKGSSESLTKYNTSSSYGTVDNITTLELSDDAVRANWGGSWRMPTDAELTELREQCTWTWTSQNGVNGYKVTSKKSGYTNNSIFLPAAGYRGGSLLNGAGSYCDYWSSSLSTDYPGRAWGVTFGSGYVSRFDGNRYCGFAVRPVCP